MINSRIIKTTRLLTCHFQPHRSQHLKVFEDNATKWWNGKEFDLLRSMNSIRVPFIVNGLDKPITEARILDVGCGGGLLSEPLSRLGANVLGIDPVFESINQAQLHSEGQADLKERLKYRNCNIEDLSSQQEHIENYDAVVASEVLEHVHDVEGFLKHCSKLIKPNGSLFITTINQTPLSWLGVIFFGEYILKQLPKGTHTYDMFVNVKGLMIMLERLGYRIRLVNGFMYEPISGDFFWTPTTLTHYALQAIKVNPLHKGVNYEQRRNAPKRKLSRPKIVLDDDELNTVIPYDIFKEKSNSIVREFAEHLEKTLTLRASTSSLERLKIEIEGLDDTLEVRDVAQMSMKGSSLIVLNLSAMPEAIKPIVKALEALGNLSPQVEVNNIYVPVPRVTREHREKLWAAAKKTAEQTKEKLKQNFSQFSSKAKDRKSKCSVSDDTIRATVENLDFQTKVLIAQIDELLNKKKTEWLLQSGDQ